MRKRKPAASRDDHGGGIKRRDWLGRKKDGLVNQTLHRHPPGQPLHLRGAGRLEEVRRALHAGLL